MQNKFSSAVSSSAAQTRRKIIAAAVKLMAERGIDAVSLNEIVKASGQRNASALQYHFGNKAGLVQAIFDYHMPRIEQCRKQYVDALDEQRNPQAIAEAVVMPLVKELDNPDGGRDYLRFLARITLHDLQPPEFATSSHNAVLVEVATLLRQMLDDMPQAEFDHRFLMARSLLLHSLALYCVRIEGNEALHQQQVADFTRVLIDALVGVFLGNPESHKA
jgi:AcrR family transcriptional regulator